MDASVVGRPLRVNFGSAQLYTRDCAREDSTQASTPLLFQRLRLSRTRERSSVMAGGTADNHFEKARAKIYEGHDEDPTKITVDGQEVPYETHYAHKMESYLAKRAPDASDVLKLAVCAQHFKRWEVPRSSYPMTKVGYHSWRTFLKKRQSELVGSILQEYYPPEDIQRCMALIQKDGLKQGEEEVQVLEDVACLVFLDDQFDDFQKKHDEEKMLGILKKTWVKMSPKGHEMALELPMTDECKALVGKALNG